jgi:hypothetical protein
MGEMFLGRFLGASHSIGGLMTFLVLASTGHIFSWSTVQRLPNILLQTPEQVALCRAFDTNLHQYLGNPTNFLITEQADDPYILKLSAAEEAEINCTYTSNATKLPQPIIPTTIGSLEEAAPSCNADIPPVTVAAVVSLTMNFLLIKVFPSLPVTGTMLQCVVGVTPGS